MGSGRKRLNILGGYCPDDHEYIDYRLTRDNINGEQFVNFLRFAAGSLHPQNRAAAFILCTWTGHATTGSPVVKEWLRRHPEFHLSQIPAYSPNVNLIEHMWKFLRAKALIAGGTRHLKTCKPCGVPEVLDHLEDYRGELRTLMTEKFHHHRQARHPRAIPRVSL